MNMEMILRYNGQVIASYEEKTWWLTSFNPSYYNVNAADLSVEFCIHFDSSQMYYDFKSDNGDWGFSDND